MDKQEHLPVYSGKELTHTRIIYERDKDGNQLLDEDENPVVKERIPPYIPNEEIQEAVALTRILQRPLLLKGEPGCGKTRLAKAVAFELYQEDYDKYYFEWNIKSTSKARDGLFTFDYVGELRDAQMKVQKEKKHYRKFGQLGEAFRVSTREHPAILLIDEIDKADIDFPNDLLLELDQLRFNVDETGEEIKAGYPPIIFITSNDEKPLPKAFLRRCLFHFVEFPQQDVLQTIVRANFPFFAENLVKAAVERFDGLREEMKKELNTEKKVSTSELIDWVRVINHFYLNDVMDGLEAKIQGKNLSEDEAEKVQELISGLLENTIKNAEQLSAAKEKIAEAVGDLEPADPEFPRQLMGALSEEIVTGLMEKLKPGSVLYHHALIKSFNDYKLHVTKAKAQTGKR